MTIKEYAEDINRSVEDIIKHMESLAMDTTDKNRILSDDEIILLDNSFQDEEDYVEETPDEEMIKDFSLDEKAEQIAYESNLTNENEVKVNKVKKPKKQERDNNFKQERKKIYKHKEKLQSNEHDLDDNTILYNAKNCSGYNRICTSSWFHWCFNGVPRFWNMRRTFWPKRSFNTFQFSFPCSSVWQFPFGMVGRNMF